MKWSFSTTPIRPLIRLWYGNLWFVGSDRSGCKYDAIKHILLNIRVIVFQRLQVIAFIFFFCCGLSFCGDAVNIVIYFSLSLSPFSPLFPADKDAQCDTWVQWHTDARAAAVMTGIGWEWYGRPAFCISNCGSHEPLQGDASSASKPNFSLDAQLSFITVWTSSRPNRLF